MKKIKETKKKVTKKPVEEESINLKSVIKTFIIILIFFIIFYGLTIIVVNKKNEKKKNEKTNYTNLKVESNDIIVSDILKQDKELYYVIAIKGDKDIYKLYLNNLGDKLYNINLDNALNKSILGNETIISEDPKDIRINDTTLFVVENNVITEHYVGKEEVVNKLSTIAF